MCDTKAWEWYIKGDERHDNLMWNLQLEPGLKTILKIRIGTIGRTLR